MSLGVFALVVLAAYRLTRFVTLDSLTEPARLALARRFPPAQVPLLDAGGKPIPGSATNRPHWLVVFVNCPWCVSVWVALAIVVILRLCTTYVASWGVAALIWLAAATLVGLISRLEV